jgi:hypothetical protein
MSQIFHPSTNTFSKATIFGAIFFLIGLGALGLALARSPYVTDVGVVRPQPVQFSHEHHTNALGIDCRYCHTSVEEAQYAGMPPTHTCMSCHSQIWNDSPALAPVRESYATGIPIAWNEVHRVPDYAYFNHSIHIQKGFGCSECHGQVDDMTLMYKAEPMTMEWCLDCHRNPQDRIRPVEEVFNMDYVHPPNQAELGRQLLTEYNIPHKDLTQCYVCHR